jgi:hypothetical protein
MRPPLIDIGSGTVSDVDGRAGPSGAPRPTWVRVEGFRNAVRDVVPTVVLAAEHYNMLVRMVQAGASPQLRIEVGARSYERRTLLHARNAKVTSNLSRRPWTVGISSMRFLH